MNEINQNNNNSNTNKQQIFVPKEEKLQELRTHESYKNMEQKRPKHQSYALFSKEVTLHKEIMKNDQSTRNTLSRPITAKIKNTNEKESVKIIVKRPESSKLEKVNQSAYVFFILKKKD